MSKISTYPILSTPTLNDLLIGTDVENLNETKNFSLSSIGNLIGQNYVPYVGATGNVDLGVYSIEGSAFIVNGGTASQFLKADGTLDSTFYVPQTRTITINSVGYDLSANRSWDLPTIDSLTTLGTSGAATYIGKVLNIPIYQAQGNYITQLSGEATALGPGNATVTLSNSAVISKVLTGLNITGGNVIATDTILQAFGKVQNQINGLTGGVTYQGTWNAATNTPFLQSSVGTKGYYYVVSVPGTTNLNGITDWQLGDWAIYNGTAWEKVDNTDAVVSVNGYTGAVMLTYSDVGAPPATRTLTINGVGYDLSLDRSWTVGNVRTDQTYADPSWITSLGWSKIINTPTTLAGYGITDGVSTARTLTINGVGYDLTADRTWSVGTVTSVGTTAPLTGGTITGSGTIGITQASAISDGYLSSTDWSTFNSKQNAITASAPLSLVAGTLSITQAGVSSDGYLSSTDWNTFNSKVGGSGTANYLPIWTSSSVLGNSSLSFSLDTLTVGYNSITGGAVSFTNIGLTPYTYSIQMNNFGSPRSTFHNYTDGIIVQAIASTQVSRMFDNGNFILGTGTTDTGHKLTISGDLYVNTIANAIVDTDRFIVSDGGIIKYRTGAQILTDIGAVSSVGLTMPAAFTVSNSPITSSGTIAVTGAGTAAQYIRGDGTLGDFPGGGGGGGASVSYYLNGSVNQGTFGGNTYYEMNKTPIFGPGTDFNISLDGYVAQFITDVGDPDALLIPGGNWNFETYFSASSGGGSPTFYIELYKYDGTTFTLIASNSTNPELIAFGTTVNPYFSALAVPETVLLATDRLAVRIYVSTSGRTITLHTENSNLCQVITTFTTGLTALNGLTKQVQYFSVGTSGTDFNISSSVATHTFNLPTASAVNRGALSSSDWSTFNAKQNALTLTTSGSSGPATLIGATLNIPDYGSALSGYVPYTGASQAVNLGIHSLSGGTLFVNGTSPTSGSYLGFKQATSVTTGGGGYTSISTFGTSQMNFSFAQPSGFKEFKFDVSSITTGVPGGRVYTMPDADGTIALTSNIPSGIITGTGTTNYLPKFTGTSSIGNSIVQDAGIRVDIGGDIRLTPTSAVNIQAYTGSVYTNLFYNAASHNWQTSGGVTKMFLNSNDNLLIGTTTDGGQRLQVTGTVALRASASGSSATQIPIFAADPSGTTRELVTRTPAQLLSDIGGQAALTNPVTGTGTTNYLPKFTGSTTVGNSAITDDGTSVNVISRTLTITRGNYSAFGFEINQQSTFAFGSTNGKRVVIITDATAADNGLQFGYDTVDKTGIIAGSATSAGAGIDFYTYNGSAWGNRARVTASGNVLVGTTTDNGARLQVSGTATFSSNVAAGSTSSGAQINVFASSYGNNGLFNAYGTDNLIKLQMGALGTNEGFIFTGSGNKISFFSGGNLALTLNSNQTATFSSSVTAARFISSTSSSYTNDFLNLNIGTVGQSIGLRFGYDGSSYNKGAIYFVSRDSAGRGNMQFALDPSASSSNVSTSNAIMTLNYEGNVGIGTASPSAPLHIVTPTGVNFQNAIRFEKAGGYGEVNLENYYTSGSNYGFGIDVAGTTMMVVNNLGNVGIGTTSPVNKLHLGDGKFIITSNNGSYGQLQVNAPAGGEATILLSSSGSGQNSGGYTNAGVIGMGAYGNSANTLVFGTGYSGGTMFIKNSNVLIGTTTDNGYKLNVNGSLQANAFNFNVGARNFKSYLYGTDLTVNTGGGWAQSHRIYNEAAPSQTWFFGAIGTTAYIRFGDPASIDITGYNGVGFGLTSSGAATFDSSVTAGGDGIYGNNRQGNNAGTTVVNILGSSSSTTSAQLNLTQVWNGLQYPIVLKNIYNPVGGAASSVFTLSTTQWNGSIPLTTERFRIDGNSGNVGIGTTNPTNRLHVASPDNEGIFMQGTSNGGHWFNFSSANSNLWSMGAQPGLMGWYNRTDATYKMVITDAGNVGIGTTNPLSNSTSTSRLIQIHAPFTNGWAITKYTNDTTGSGGADGALFGVIGLDSYVYNYEVGQIIFGTSSSTRMTIASGGNVLIGTTTDNGYKLNVNGNTYSTTLTLGHVGLNVSDYNFYSQTISGAMGILGHNLRASASVANQVNVVNSGWYSSMIKMYYSEGITFHTSLTSYSAGDVYPMAATERMRITSGGNVLIGTTTDVGATLYVNGTIRTGTLTAGTQTTAVDWRLGNARGGAATNNALIRVQINGVLVDLLGNYV